MAVPRHGFLKFIKLLGSPCDATLCEVIYRNLNCYVVAGENSNIVNSELTRNMSCHDVTVGKLYLEGRVGQCLNYRTFKFNYIVLWQNNPSSAFICDLRLFWISTLTTLYPKV